MAQNTQLVYANRFYMLSQLMELRPLYQQVSQKLGRYTELKNMEADGRLFEQGREADFEECLALDGEFRQMEEKYAKWERQTTDFLQMPLEDIKKTLGLGDRRKNKSGREASAEVPPLQKMKLLMDDVLGKDLWNGGNVDNSLAGMYIRSLSQYVCAPEAAQSADFDSYVTDKIERINQILPRSVEYQSAQAILLKKIKDNSRNEETLKKAYGKYCRQIVLREASTKGPDNQFFRCMASGRFYVEENENRYSDYFVSRYGKDFCLPPSTRGNKAAAGSFLNIDDMLELTERTYDEETAKRLKREIKIKGISEADFDKLNACDLCKIVQSGRAAQNGETLGRSLKQINPDCPDSPYRRQAKMLGMMLATGEKCIQKESRTEGNAGALRRLMEFETIKAGKYMSVKAVYEENFKDLYETFDSFLPACKRAFQFLERDFSKYGMKDYFEKWIPQLCDGNNMVRDFEGKKPYDINIHHKIPIKMAKDLDNPAAINDVCNFCMFIEFAAPTDGKLTKHLQEHNKESAGMAAVGEKADMRFVVTSGNTRLEHAEAKEPESFAKLRRRESIQTGNTVLRARQNEAGARA